MKKGLKLELISYTSHSQLFLGFSEDIKVVIRGLKTRNAIFTIKAEDHNLVLGQCFLNSVKFNSKNKLNGIFNTITHLHIPQMAILHSLISQDLANQSEN